MSFEQLEIQQPLETSISLNQLLPWLMYTVAALFYCYAFFLRIAPSMMMNEVMQHFHISAGQFGNLSAFYYYAYTPLQLPIGVIIDRYGARMVLCIAALICVSGISIFISTDSLVIAALGRFMMGFGSAFGYITVLKIASIWLPSNRFAFAAGLTTAFGMVAGIFTDNYLAHIVQNVGFKDAFYSSIMIGLVLCGVIFSILRNRPKNDQIATQKTTHERPSFQELFRGVGKILSNKQTWIIGLIGCLLYLPSSVFLDLYAPQYLKIAHGLDVHQAAHMVSCVFAGWILGGPIIGAISDYIKLRRLPLFIASVLGTAVIMVIFYVHNLPIGLLTALMFFLGICCGSHPLVFSLAKENAASKLSGSATATSNFLIMMGGLIWQPGVGLLLDKHWSGTLENGIRVYSASDFNFALAIIPIGLLLAIVLTVFLKETHCRSQVD